MNGETIVPRSEWDNLPITLVKTDQASRSSRDTRGNHARAPDLSPNIKVVFPGPARTEYIGVYLNHGKNKTVFLLKSCNECDLYHGDVLKVAREKDGEPAVFRCLKAACFHLAPDVLYECSGFDNREEYHCWITERCIPLNQFVESSYANKEKCVLAACRCIVKAASVGLLLSDCHFFNFGVLVSRNEKMHHVVIIDAGSRNISEIPRKGAVNDCLKSLWRWATQEIQAPYEAVRELWTECHSLDTAMQRIDAKWLEEPIVTVREMTTAEVDAELISKCSSALRAFMASPQEKVIALIGRSAYRGVWNEEMSASCFRAGRELRASLTFAGADVIAELYGRLTHDTRGNCIRPRTTEEVDEIIKFWWHLQGWRKWWLEKHYREDSDEEILTEAEMQDVRRAWEYHEMWHELTEEQKRKRHLPSIYNAALNNKSGWANIANAILRNKMPQIPDIAPWASATEQAKVIGGFTVNFVTWLSVFAQSLVKHWRSTGYKKARQTSGHDAERTYRDMVAPSAGDAVVDEHL